MVKFKEFKVGDIVEIKKTKTYHKLIVEEYKGFGKPINYVTRTTFNNAVEMLAICEDDYIINEGNDIIFGAESAKFYYQENPYLTGDKIYKLKVKNKYVGLYLAALFTALIKDMGFSYSNGLIPKRLESLNVFLPVTTEGIPDYAYMEDYIKGIQRQYIDNLLETNESERNRLLSIVGLSLDEYDCVKGNIELSDAENYGEFKVIDIYPDIQRGKRLTKADRVVGKTPLVTAGEEHYGIAEYIENHSVLNKSNSLTIDMFGNVFYRDYEYFSDDNIISLYNENFTANINMYVVGSLQKIGVSYNYSNQFRMKSLETTRIQLPTTPTGEIDYAYMEDYISKIKLIYIYNRELSVNEQVDLLRNILTD